MIATYRLSQHIPSFEFFNWLVMAIADGATEIVFDISNPKTIKAHTDFGLDNVLQRFRSIVEPGPALAGLSSRKGSDHSTIDPTASRLLPWFKSGRDFSRLQSVKAPIDCKFTVTIRENKTGGAKGRDSNRDAWETFAADIGAVVIDDYCRRPIHLHDRIALYAGARMNFGVCNGPVHMLSLTPYPVAMWINTQSAYDSQARWGIQPNQKYPWMLENQTMIWRKDTVENLRRAFDEMKL